jgi:hypothetical protein
MHTGLTADERGVSPARIALIAGGLAIASLAGVRILESSAQLRAPAAMAMETQTDLERLARTIPAGKNRAPASAIPAAAQIDFTATANNGGKRGIQYACHGSRTVAMVAPAGGPPVVLSTCGSSKN